MIAAFAKPIKVISRGAHIVDWHKKPHVYLYGTGIVMFIAEMFPPGPDGSGGIFPVSFYSNFFTPVMNFWGNIPVVGNVPLGVSLLAGGAIAQYFGD